MPHGLFNPFRLRRQPLLPAEVTVWLGRLLGSGAEADPPQFDLAPWLPSLHVHGIMPLVYLATRDWPVEWLSPAARQGLTAGFQRQLLRTHLLETELTSIVRDLHGGGVNLLLLKGAATARTIYSSPAERPVSDLDLLAPIAQIDVALRLLAARGFASVGVTWLGSWQRRYRSETAVVGAGQGNRHLLVELHWSLLEIPYYIDRIRIDDLWGAAMPAPDLDGALVPDPAALLLHTCAHLAYHHSQDLRLIWLVDIARLTSDRVLDWDRVFALAKDWQVGCGLAAGVEVATRWLGTPLTDTVRAELAKLAAEPVSRAMWGVGDECSGMERRKAMASWRAFGWRQRARYAAWLGLRAVSRPVEARRLRRAKIASGAMR